jgi:hypothetical protein
VGKQQKPKVTTKPVEESRRTNGKKSKQNPKISKRKDGGSVGGYGAAAAARRAARRAPVSLAGLRGTEGGVEHPRAV